MVEVPENKSAFSNPPNQILSLDIVTTIIIEIILLQIATLLGRYLFLESNCVCKFLKAKS